MGNSLFGNQEIHVNAKNIQSIQNETNESDVYLDDDINVILFGNSGVGKSFLCNSLLSKYEHRHGLQFRCHDRCSNMTNTSNTYKNITDTPGLSRIHKDDQMRSSIEITKALRRNGTYRLIFIITLANDHVQTYDLITMRIILNSLKNLQIVSYGVIFNKISPMSYTRCQNNVNVLMNSINDVMAFETNHFYLCEQYPITDQYGLPSSAVIRLIDFIKNVPPVTLNDNNIMDIPYVDYLQLVWPFEQLITMKKTLREMKSLPDDDYTKGLNLGFPRIRLLNDQIDSICNASF